MAIWHCILSAELTKTYSFRLLFRWFCPLGNLAVIIFLFLNLFFLPFYFLGRNWRETRCVWRRKKTNQYWNGIDYVTRFSFSRWTNHRSRCVNCQLCDDGSETVSTWFD